MAEAEHQLPDTFDVGGWRVDANALTVSRGADTRALEPRAHKVLRYLAERPGELVTIDALMDANWAGSVVTPNAVTRVVAQLRKALDDDARNPEYIETVSRTGYRLIAPVTESGDRQSTDARRLVAVGGAVLALAAILWFAWPQSEAEPTVAVLPFQNLTGEPGMDYVGDGVAEEIINTLTQVDAFRVSARSQSFGFRGAEPDIGEAASQLGVAFVVVGSVRRDGQNIRVTAQLVDADKGVNVWSLTREHDVLELFEGQDSISRGVAGALAKATGSSIDSRSLTQRAQPDPEAYDLYLHGRHIWHRRGNEPLQPAIDYFLEAVKIDPEFARGWGALATAYLTYPNYSPKGYATWHLAEDAARKALALDPDIAEAYGVLATFAYTRLEWEESEALYREGIRRNDRSATAHYWYGEFLAIVGKHMQSAEQLRRTIELDPTYQPPQLTIAFTHLTFRDIEGAAQRFQALWQRGHRIPVSWLGNFMSYVLLGDFDRATAWIDMAFADEEQKDLLRRFVAVEAGAGLDGELATEMAAYFWNRPDYPMAIWMLAALGAEDTALALLNSRLDRGLLIELRPLWAPGLDLSDRPGFMAFLERTTLLDYWESSGWGDVCVLQNREINCDAPQLTPANMPRILYGADETS